MYENRKYIILNNNELYKVDFTKVLESSINTLRKSLDENKVLIKYQGSPLFISTINTLEGPYTLDEIVYILAGEEWTIPPFEESELENNEEN